MTKETQNRMFIEPSVGGLKNVVVQLQNVITMLDIIPQVIPRARQLYIYAIFYPLVVLPDL